MEDSVEDGIFAIRKKILAVDSRLVSKMLTVETSAPILVSVVRRLNGYISAPTLVSIVRRLDEYMSIMGKKKFVSRVRSFDSRAKPAHPSWRSHGPPDK